MNALENIEHDEAVSAARPAAYEFNHGVPTPEYTHAEDEEALPPVKQVVDEKTVEENLAAFDLPTTLPTNYMVAIELGKKISSTPALTKAAIEKRAAACAKLKRHIFDLQQGLPTVERAVPTYERTRHIGRAAGREGIVDGLTKIILNGGLDSTPLKIKPCDPLVMRAIADETDFNILRPLLVAGRKHLAAYSLAFFSAWEKINPHDRAEELKIELSNAANLSLERVEAIQSELSKLESAGAEIVADATNGILAKAFEPVAETSEMFLAELIEVLSRHRDTAVLSETGFFQYHGMRHEATSVSRRYDPVIAGLRKKLDSLRNVPAHISRHRPVQPEHALISNFVEVLPGVI